MSDFPGNYDTLDCFAFRAAVEAVIGLTLQDKQVNQETVQACLATAVDPQIPSRQIQGRAMYFAERIFSGPLRPDGSVG